MERKNDFHLLENLTKRNSRRRLLKRALALVSVVVLLVTANVLKRNAVAMVGETFCGYDYDHTHTEECFDGNGALICDLHVHTDECYEEPTPEEVEVDLSDLEEATEAVEETEAVESEAVPSDGTFDLAGSHQVMLSEVLAQTMLPVSRDQIEMVGLVDDSLQGDEAQGEAPVAVAMLEQDVAITALRDFSTAEIAIVTADDIYTVQLMNGAASAEIEAAAEETTEETEETVEETAETAEENTENIEEIIETTEEEPQEVAAEPAQESEITEAVEEHTEENSEANIEETVEEITAEITDGDEAETEPAEIDETVTGEVVEETVETEEADEETAETEETAEVEETEEAAAEMQAIEASEEAAEAVAEIEETEENTEAVAEIEETEENTEETAEIEETEETTEETEEEAAEESEEATEETEEESEEETTEEETAEEETEEESEEKSEEEETEEEATEEETAEEESEEESTKEEAAEEKTEEEETTEEESEEESEEEETSEEEATEEEESEEESEEEETTEEESEEASEEEAAEALDIETLFPAQTFEDHADNIRVTVTAGVGAFPAGTEMRLTPVWDQETLDGIADSVSEDFVEVKQVLAVDIAFFNAEGEEIEPLLPVSVVMAVEEIEQHQDAVVVHMDDEGNTEVVEQTETAFTEDTERALNVELPAAENAEAQMAQLVEKLEAEAAEQTEAETEPAEAEAADEPAAEAEGVEVVTEEVAIETEKAEPAGETTEVTFEADGFSLYAVVVTETIETRYIAADGATFNISVRYGEDARIPANATLAVEELTGEATEDYLAQTEELLAEGETITLARYFDITILDAEGNAMQPQAPVSVEVKLADDPADAVQAVHFAEEGAELIDASRNDEEAVTFSAEGFSVYGIVYTVDFYYDVDGKTYEYHIKGGDVQSLKALLPILKVVEEDAAEEFVANIEDVRFSDESLVKVFRVDEDTTAGAILEALGVKLEAHARPDEAVEAPEEISEEDIDALEAAAEGGVETEPSDEIVEEANPSAALTEEDIENIKAKTFTAPDWALVSLQPFFTEEALTITLRNGEVMTIRVEDASGTWSSGYLNVGYLNGNSIVENFGRGKIRVYNQGSSNYLDKRVYDNYLVGGDGTLSDYQYNTRWISPVGNPGYVFDHWEVTVGNGHHTSYTYNTKTLIAPGEFDLAALRRGEVFTAIMVPIERHISVDKNCWGRGYVWVPEYHHAGDEEITNYIQQYWDNGSGYNKTPIDAVPYDGYQFVRWEYYEQVQTEEWVRDPSKDLTQKRFEAGQFELSRGGVGWHYKAIFQPAGLTICVDRTDVGDVVDENGVSCTGLVQLTQNGKLPKTIKAVSNDSHLEKYGHAFGYWTLDGVILPITSATINPEDYPEIDFANATELQAHFAQLIDGHAQHLPDMHPDEGAKTRFENWLNSMGENKKLIADKTAMVYDYDNRIYQVDITGESVLFDLAAQIDLAFIMDASNSMQFPATLEKVHEPITLTQETLNALYPNGDTCYIISYPDGSSTVYKVFKTGGQWYYVDASLDDSEKVLISIESSYNEQSDVREDMPLTYPIYKASGSAKRWNNLYNCMDATIDSMEALLGKVKAAGGDTQKIRVAYSTFAADPGNPEHTNAFKWEDFQYLNPDDPMYVDMGDNGGGTRQDLALEQAKRFSWDSSHRKYAVLITDGAPAVKYGASTTVEDIQGYIRTQAEDLKRQGVTLITVGLSTENVKGGADMLYDIASYADVNNTGRKLYFEAKNEHDLEGILYEILEAIMAREVVAGKVVDTVDPAFYPVLANGTPIQPNTYYKADGTQISYNEYIAAMNRLEPVYKWECNDGVWKITWEKQYFGWNHNSNDYKEKSWNGTFHVKAKENFLGGNTISTNASATVTQEAHGPKNGDSIAWNLTNGDKGNGTVITLPVPYVNVDELSLTQNSSEWTVYLGTEVDPLAELKNLFDKIEVKEVVTQTTDGQHVIMTAASDTLYPIERSNTDGREPKNGAAPETFPLSVVAPLTPEQWQTLIEGGQVGVPYQAYGHENVGLILYQLEKTVVTGEERLTNGAHETKVVGDAVEKYILKATYAPTMKNPPADWHTTPGSGNSHGKDAELTNTSENQHIINVFAKKLAVKKMDATLTTALQGAKFALVKTNGSTPTVGDDSTYEVIEELTVDSSGSVFTSNYIRRPKANEKYFLIETQAPSGYVGLGVPVPVSLVINDKYRAVPRVSDAYGTDPLSMPYDWIEEATLSLDTTNIGRIKRATEAWVEDNTALTPDSACATLYYKVPNNPGVQLPSTGGAGTGAYTAIGGALALLAIALMLRRQKEN